LSDYETLNHAIPALSYFLAISNLRHSVLVENHSRLLTPVSSIIVWAIL